MDKLRAGRPGLVAGTFAVEVGTLLTADRLVAAYVDVVMYVGGGGLVYSGLLQIYLHFQTAVM